MYFICHVTPQDHSVVMHIYMHESFSQHAVTLKSLVIIGIVIVELQNASSKTRIL